MNYPQRLPKETGKSYWSEDEVFPQQAQPGAVCFMHHNYRIGMHSHAFFEVNIITEGTGRHYIGENSFPISAGDVFIIPPEVSHGYAGDGLEVYHMLLHESFFQSYLEGLRGWTGFVFLFSTEPFLRSTVSKSFFLHLDVDDIIRVKKSAEASMQYGALTSAAGRALICTEAAALIGRLCMQMAMQLNADRFSEADISLMIRDCLNYINLHLEEKLTVEMLARRHGVSRATLYRYFERTCGCTPLKYIDTRRVQEARRLMRAGQSMTGAAQNCGFYDASHLRRHLKQDYFCSKE